MYACQETMEGMEDEEDDIMSIVHIKALPYTRYWDCAILYHSKRELAHIEEWHTLTNQAQEEFLWKIMRDCSERFLSKTLDSLVALATPYPQNAFNRVKLAQLAQKRLTQLHQVAMYFGRVGRQIRPVLYAMEITVSRHEENDATNMDAIVTWLNRLEMFAQTDQERMLEGYKPVLPHIIREDLRRDTPILCVSSLLYSKIKPLPVQERTVTSHLHRARKRGLPATLTLEQWKATIRYFNYKCAYCQEKPYEVLEHFIPLRHGGGTTASNCVPACSSCNDIKGSLHPNERNLPLKGLPRVQAYLDSMRQVEGE